MDPRAAATFAALMEAQHPPLSAQATARPECSVSVLLRKLETELGSERLAILRLGAGDWEARTYSGDVGRGLTLGDAIADLLQGLAAAEQAARSRERRHPGQ